MFDNISAGSFIGLSSHVEAHGVTGFISKGQSHYVALKDGSYLHEPCKTAGRICGICEIAGMRPQPAIEGAATLVIAGISR